MSHEFLKGEKESIMKDQQKSRMSEVCQIAHKIYELYQSGDKGLLEIYFRDQLMIPAEQASEFAEKYTPKKAPSEVCPLEVISGSWKSSRVFDELSLQFSSINENSVISVWPKNILAWWIMRIVFGSDVFDFEIRPESTGEIGKNGIDFPARPCDEDGYFVPFGLTAIEAVSIESLPAHVVRKAKTLKERLGKECGTALAKTILDADFIFPPTKEVKMLVDVIERGLSGEEVIITGAFCPDYAYESTGDLGIPFRYTFDNVGSGVGLVAKQFVRTIPFLENFLNSFGIKHRFILGIGDFEANSQEILRRVGVSREEFILRCILSLGDFKKEMGDIPVELRLFEHEWANGRWQKYIEEAHSRMKAGDFGDIQFNTGKNPRTEVVQFIAKASGSFYCSWYGKDFSHTELEQLIIAQGAEYAAMGRVLKEDFFGQPFFQIAGDRPKMQSFNAMYSAHPTICTKRTY